MTMMHVVHYIVIEDCKAHYIFACTCTPVHAVMHTCICACTVTLCNAIIILTYVYKQMP